jgi:TatD DNase family protein
MRLFDSHCHLNDPVFEKDFKEVLNRMDTAHVKATMIVGTGAEDSAHAVNLAESQSYFYAAVGVHPHDAAQCSESSLAFLRVLAQNPKVRAWGETGLDFNRMHSPASEQEKWFIRQVETARELGLPLIFHERDSGGRFADILKTFHQEKWAGVVHCFSGDRREMDIYLDLGLCIGITGVLTIEKRGADLRDLAPHIPEDRILIETDAPYLTPAPQRNKTRRNEPAFVKSTLLKLADIRGESPEYLSERVWENTCRLFKIHEDSPA